MKIRWCGLTIRSDWLPSDTQRLNPIPASCARLKIETISAPLWLIRPIEPSPRLSVLSTTDEHSAM